MSDYLGNLVARTLAPNFGVRPRLPSRFEPASFDAERQPLPNQEARSPAETVARQPADQPEFNRPPPLSAGQHPQEAAPGRSVADREPAGGTLREGNDSKVVAPPRPAVAESTGKPKVWADDSAVGRALPPRIGLPALPAATPATGHGQSGRTTPTRDEEAVDPAARDPAWATPAVAPAGPQPAVTHIEPATVVPSQVVVVREVEPSLKPALPPYAPVKLESPVPRPLVPKPAIPSASGPPANARGVRVETSSIRPLTLAQAPRVGPPISLPAAKELAPTINVTIGRIEVRALPAAPPTGKAAARGPAMKLDEYLRQRATGGQR